MKSRESAVQCAHLGHVFISTAQNTPAPPVYRVLKNHSLTCPTVSLTVGLVQCVTQEEKADHGTIRELEQKTRCDREGFNPWTVEVSAA
ncbi:hypothetical protein SKAU_G00111820 [Synaphobranchus kaupii]|uniref:Uncharacterized protein n=1 Tax=Synaphobranchus kaupii TaxID=118154 RepID=A0A9Q1G0C8_SYNKA|nr:hypothetical protein SKAU_G00111820 [Synaphobranchus kaupii]